LSITEISGHIILLTFIYALYMIPKSLGEYEGVKKEQPDPFIGKTKEKCKWTHGITFKSASIGFIILLPLLLFIEEIIRKYFGITIAAIIIILILIPITYYERKQSKINKIEVDKRNKKEEKLKAKKKKLKENN